MFVGVFKFMVVAVVALQMLTHYQPKTKIQLELLITKLFKYQAQKSIRYLSGPLMARNYKKTKIIFETYFCVLSIMGLLFAANFSHLQLQKPQEVIMEGWNEIGSIISIESKQSENMTWWMKLFGLICTILQIDFVGQAGFAMATVLVAALTMEDISSQFYRCFKISGKYIKVPTFQVTLKLTIAEVDIVCTKISAGTE